MPDRSRIPERLAIHRIADEHGTRLDDGSDPKQKICGGAIVDRHQHDALEQAPPQRDEPLGAILRPDRDGLSLADAFRCEAARRMPCARLVISAYVYDQLR